MKKAGYIPVMIFGFALMSILSFVYWKDLSEQVVTASSNVNGRELPIYNVQTDKPQISLSFDAAWGDVR